VWAYIQTVLDLIDKSAISACMLWAHEHGVWDIINTLLFGLSLTGVTILLWRRRRIRNLNFFVRRLPRDDSDYPLKVYVEIRNYTGRSVVISAPYFVYARLRADPNARGHSPSREYEIKFPDPVSGRLTEVEYLLRHRENVSTWVPIDPAHTDDEVDAAIRRGGVGKLHCMCTWLQDTPKVHRLITPI